MATAGIKAAAYCLNFAPELALHYGGTPAQERKSKPDSEFLRALPEHTQTYEEAQAYAPNKTYIGAMSIDELEKAPAPWIDNLGTPERFGTFGEIMPEDEFLGLMDICDVFDLIWLEEGFAASVAEKLAQNPVIGEKQLARLEKGRPEPASCWKTCPVRPAACSPCCTSSKTPGFLPRTSTSSSNAPRKPWATPCSAAAATWPKHWPK